MVWKVCPNCKKEYETKLNRKTNSPAQIEFPNATAEEREQLISGICSTKCWNKYLGIRFDINRGSELE